MIHINSNLTLHTLWLTTPTFKIKDNNRFIIEGFDKDNPTGKHINKFDLYCDEFGEIKSGKSGYYISSDKSFRLSIDPIEDKPFLGLQIPSIQRFIGKSEIDIITTADIRELFDLIKNKLLQVGVSICIDDFFVTRIDINRTFKLKHPLKMYQPLFDLLHINRMPESKTGSSTYFSNKSKTINIYDKLEHLKIKKNPLAKIIKSNLCRFEIRLKKRHTIEDALGNRKITSLPTCFTRIDDYFQDTVNDLFDIEMAGAEVNQITPIELLEKLADHYTTTKGKRGYDNQVLRAIGAGTLANFGITPKVYRAFIGQRSGKHAGWRKEKEIREYQLIYMLLASNPDNISYAGLFEEFQNAALGKYI